MVKRISILSLVVVSVVGVLVAQFAYSDVAETRLITLGTAAGPAITPYRSQPASVVVVRGKPYLFDAGNGVLRQLALAQVPFQKIQQIFLTHLHDDHTADVGTVFAMQWDLPGQGHKLDVYGPPGTSETVRGYLKFFARNAEIRESDVDAPGGNSNALYAAPETLFEGHDIDTDGLVFTDENIKVYAAENSHYHFKPGTPAYGRDKSYSYRVETPDRVIVFSGDTGPSDALAKLAKGADILVTEVISREIIENEILPQVVHSKAAADAMIHHMEFEHLSPEEIGKMASQAGIKIVVLSHVAPGRPNDSDSIYTDGVRKFFKGKVVLAKDLDTF